MVFWPEETLVSNFPSFEPKHSLPAPQVTWMFKHENMFIISSIRRVHNFTDCGGTYTNASGILVSPLHPKPYPHLAHCIYLISQPNGTYVNVSFITMDIVCQERHSTSDYIEMRDGNSKDSPLMGRFCGNGSNIFAFMISTKPHLRLRWRSAIYQNHQVVLS